MLIVPYTVNLQPGRQTSPEPGRDGNLISRVQAFRTERNIFLLFISYSDYGTLICNKVIFASFLNQDAFYSLKFLLGWRRRDRPGL